MPTTLDLPNNDFNDFPNLYDVHNASHNEIQFYPTKATFLGTPDLNESLIISSDRSSCSDDGLLYTVQLFEFSLSLLMQLMLQVSLYVA